MKVKLITEFSGTRDGVPWPKRGEVVDLPAVEAAELLREKHAVPVEAKKPETASVQAPVETASVDTSAPVNAAPAKRGRPDTTGTVNPYESH